MEVNDTPRYRLEYEQKKWKIFFLLGLVLLIGGVLSVLVPNISTYASSIVLGAVLMGIGTFKIFQSLAVKSWAGFVWQELTGVLELIGGIMVFFNPLKGALAVTLLIAIVFFVHGFLQFVLSFKVRNISGWYWFAISGAISISASVAIILKMPHTITFLPGSIAGFALIIAGAAYVAMSLSIRRSIK